MARTAVTLRADAFPPAMRDQVQRPAARAHGSYPWLTAVHSWVMAGNLRLGERVVRPEGATATVAALAAHPGVADYCNLTVSQLHTYAGGAGQFVVHNCGINGQLDATNKVLGQNCLYHGKPRTDVSKANGWSKIADNPEAPPVNSPESRKFIEDSNPGYTFSDQEWGYRSQTWQRGNTKVKLHFWQGGAISDPDPLTSPMRSFTTTRHGVHCNGGAFVRLRM